MKCGLQIEPDLYLSLELALKIRIWFLIKLYDVIIKINRIHLGLEFTNAICNWVDKPILLQNVDRKCN